MPEDLREIAYLRLENPDMSLRDLGQNLSTPISRSGANHRMQRLLEYAGTEVKTNGKKNLTFEQANELLEKTVSKMESGELTLEQTMEEYAKACELLAYCMKQLEQCKGKIIDINERISRLSKGDDND